MAEIQYSVCLERFYADKSTYEHAADLSLPAASVVKLLIAIALIEQNSRQGVDSAIVTTDAFAAINRYLPGAAIGQRLSTSLLLGHMIEQSDNFSSNVLISHLGLPLINAVARSIGLEKTRVHGLFLDSDAPLMPRGYTTARDCNKMLRYILASARGVGVRNDLQKGYLGLLQMMEKQSDRRFIPSAAPPGTTVADKTGEIHGEINDAAIIDPLGKSPVLFAVLAHGYFTVYHDTAKYERAVEEIRNHVREIYKSYVVTDR